jgi:hypothetical protein
MRILLHACCAPCCIAVIDELRQNHELAVFFYNPNIFPEAEYLKRKAEVSRLCREWSVPTVDEDYDTASWESEVGALGEKNENGVRCKSCFRMRLTRTADLAKGDGFDAFATSLTMGRLKSSPVINEIGRLIAIEYGVDFLDEDWKKKGRWEKGRTMTLERGIYRQNYCGCRFSLERLTAAAKEKAVP